MGVWYRQLVGLEVVCRFLLSASSFNVSAPWRETDREKQRVNVSALWREMKIDWV